ncbi:MAG: porin [Burkholderiaceae bacterium]
MKSLGTARLQSTTRLLARLFVLLLLWSGGVARAQVTLFGTLDLYADYTSGAGSHLVRLDSSGLNTNRIGIKSVEPLGGDVSLTAYLEMGFNPDDGTLTGSGFDKLNYLSVLGPAGRIAMGKQYTPQFIVLSRLDAFGSSFWGTPYAVFAGGNRYTTATKAFQYQTPRMLGDRLQFSALYSLGASAATSTQKQFFASTQLWATDALYLAVVLGKDHRYTSASPDRNLVLVGAGYDFGFVRVSGGFQTLKDPNSSAQVHEWTLGASMPVTSLTKVMFNYAKSSDQASVDKVASTFGFACVHALSRSTSVYVSGARLLNGLNSSKNFGLVVNKGQATSDIMVGIRENF